MVQPPESVQTAIAAAVQALGLDPSRFRALPENDAADILARIETHFVAMQGQRWWWEYFKFDGFSVRFVHQTAFTYLTRTVPRSADMAWFVVEDASRDAFALYEGDVEAIQEVIGACYGFEYYVIARDLAWLVCENHQNYLIAIGAEVVDRLRALAFENPEQVLHAAAMPAKE